MYTFTTKGTCSRTIHFDIVNGKLHQVTFDGGCPGNLKAMGILLEGMPAREAVTKLSGITCDTKPTSCADQLARAIKEHL